MAAVALCGILSPLYVTIFRGLRLSVTMFRDAVLLRLVVVMLLPLLYVACGLSRPGDTQGLQSLGRWEWRGRLVVEPDAEWTLVRLRIDTTSRGGDVVLARYDFNPAEGDGDEYAVTLGLDLGRVRELDPRTPYPLGSAPGALPAVAAVTCLCRPLRPDSVRGTFRLARRGLRQLTGRVDATLYFTEWNDSSRHVTYSLRQRIDAVK